MNAPSPPLSWVHHGEAATVKATRLIAAAVAKARRLKPLDPIRVDAGRHATVIGGGIAGLKAAKDLAERGIEVVLVEKSSFLGAGLPALKDLVKLETFGREHGVVRRPRHDGEGLLPKTERTSA